MDVLDGYWQNEERNLNIGFSREHKPCHGFLSKPGLFVLNFIVDVGLKTLRILEVIYTKRCGKSRQDKIIGSPNYPVHM